MFRFSFDLNRLDGHRLMPSSQWPLFPPVDDVASYACVGGMRGVLTSRRIVEFTSRLGSVW
jgi:hypothetical protein